MEYLPHIGSLNKLQVILIDDTHISTIYPCDLIELSSLTELYWDGSPIDCGCQSLWMKVWTNHYMKKRPVDARLNPKGSLPDWKWSCTKPILLYNKDFRYLMFEQIMHQCKLGEQQKWCHELKSVSHGNLLLITNPLKNSLSLNWEMDNYKVFEIALFQVTVRLAGSNKIVRTMKVNSTYLKFTDLEYSSYSVCVEALGWGLVHITKTCSKVELTSQNTHSTVVITVCIFTAILAGTIFILVFSFLKKRKYCKWDSKTSIPHVSFTNQLSAVSTQENTSAINSQLGEVNELSHTFV